jgi:GTP-binding protein
MPRIALVGRPNVGKSTLFNRLLGHRTAVVSPARGTTRDRLYGEVAWRGGTLTLIDSGGFEFTKEPGLPGAIQRHIRRGLEEADGFVFVGDAQAGVLPADHMILQELRKTGKPVILAVNKADHPLTAPTDFHELGIAETFPVSALHGYGTGELLDALASRFPSEPAGAPAAQPLAVAIIGRQNVGKSSLTNALLREERVVVSEIPGTTRDAVDTRLTLDGTPFLLIDTAGLRHRRKVRDPVDLFAMSRTLQAIARCDVALLVLDATQGVTRDDQRITDQVAERGRGLVLLVNKWDLVKGGRERSLPEAIRRTLRPAMGSPVIAVSAKTGYQVPRILREARRVGQALERGLSETECRALIQAAWKSQPLPRFRGRPVKLRSVRWTNGPPPPTAELFISPVGWLPLPLRRAIQKRFALHPRLPGVTVRLIITAAKPL